MQIISGESQITNIRNRLHLFSSLILIGIVINLLVLEYGLEILEIWQSDMFLFILLGLITGIAEFLFRKKAIRPYLWSFRIFLFLLLLVQSDSVEMDLLLLFVVFLDLGISFSLLYSIILMLVFCTFCWFFFTFFHKLPFKLDLYSSYENRLLLMLPPTVFVLSLCLSYYQEKYRKSLEKIIKRDLTIRQLTMANAGFQRYANAAEHNAVDRERRRLSRELHDIVGQTFTNITSMMDAVLRNPIDDEVERTKLFTWIRSQADKGLQDSRSAMYRLRSLKELELTGIPAIKNMISTFSEATSVDIRIEWGNLPWYPDDETDLILYRILQESLVNSFHHGKAEKIDISFWNEDGFIRLYVQDNGTGGAVDHPGIGQSGMLERLLSIGGSIKFKNLNPGYLVIVEIPINLPQEVSLDKNLDH